MVLAIHLLEVDATRTLVLAQGLHRSGAGGGRHALAVEVLDGGDARIGLHHHAHFFHVGGHSEGHVFLTRSIVGGGAALQIHGAVGHQGHAVLRGDGLVLDVQLGQAQLLLDIGQDDFSHLGVEAHVLAVAQGVGQARGLTHPQGYATGGLDFGQRVVRLSKHAASSQGGDGNSQQMLFHRGLLSG